MSTQVSETTGSEQLLAEDIWSGQLYSDGWVEGPSTIDVTEPATGNVLGDVGWGTPETIASAAASAKRAQREWAAAPFEERAEVMRRAAELLKRHHEELTQWLIREAGAVRPRAEFELAVAAMGELHEAASLPSQPHGHLLPSMAPGRTSIARRVPVGVVGVIAPWNFPVILAMRSIAPALALGNAVVLKPDPNTPVVGGVLIARLFEEAGLPEGVLHVVPGGADVGEALVSSPDVDMISFTGSTKVGRAVGELAGRHLKRVALELGGKNAYIVLADADVDAASSSGAWGTFLHQGQICMAVGRHIVHESIAEKYTEALAARASHLPVGNPDTEEVALGPIINEGQIERVQRLVDESVTAGAELVTGGKRDGPYFPATVVGAVRPSMPVYEEEIFGPVAPIITFRDDAEAIEIANDTELGLSAAIQTGSPNHGLELASALQSGMVHVNDQPVNDDPHAPFGGVGASGNGVTFGTIANWDAFTVWRWITVRDQPATYPF
jgi:benzaldehyde dehydrogenase (NAD)